jgi:hypothetical protein
MARIADGPLRRLVTAGDAEGRSRVLHDGPPDDVLLDPARPGFRSARMWATDRTPAMPLTREQVARLPRSLQPPPGGSVFHIVVLPPDASWREGITREQVEAYFKAAGSPEACCHADDAPHPYMQQTGTLDLCVVLEGRVSLVLDRETVPLQAGDTVVQRGTRHAWANLSDEPAVIAISSHDAGESRASRA